MVSECSDISSKRVISLLFTLHFIVASFYLLFNNVPRANAELIRDILLYEICLIAVGFLFITAPELVKILTARFQPPAPTEPTLDKAQTIEPL